MSNFVLVDIISLQRDNILFECVGQSPCHCHIGNLYLDNGYKHSYIFLVPVMSTQVLSLIHILYGGTLEGKIAWRDKIQLQAGLTVQRSLYDSPEEWSAAQEHLSDEERHSDRISCV